MRKNLYFRQVMRDFDKSVAVSYTHLIAAIAAGGWVAVVVIIVLCLVGLIAGSVFGIFFSGEDSGTGMSMQTVVQEINQEYEMCIRDRYFIFITKHPKMNRTLQW